MRKIKGVYFNQITDEELLNFANSVNFSDWVKDRIKEQLSPKLPERTEKAILELIEKRLEKYTMLEKAGIKDTELIDDLANFF